MAVRKGGQVLAPASSPITLKQVRTLRSPRTSDSGAPPSKPNGSCSRKSSPQAAPSRQQTASAKAAYYGNRMTYLGERGLLEDGPIWALCQALMKFVQEILEHRLPLLGERVTLRKK
jgi:hypothetical protein